MKNYFNNADQENIRFRAEQILNSANNARLQALRWGDYALNKARGFSFFDYCVLGACLTSFGVFVGGLFSNFFKKLRGVLLTLFAVSWIYLFWRVFIDGNDEK